MKKTQFSLKYSDQSQISDSESVIESNNLILLQSQKKTPKVGFYNIYEVQNLVINQ